MPEADLIIRGKSVALPEFDLSASDRSGDSSLTSTRVRVVPASIHIKNGLITAIAAYDDIQPQIMLETVSEDSIIMPGLVDTHVHINEHDLRLNVIVRSDGGDKAILDMNR